MDVGTAVETVQHTATVRRIRIPKWMGNRMLMFGLLLLSFVVAAALIGPLVLDHDPNRPNLRLRVNPPSPEHLLGTDHYGRDILTRMVYGARISLMVASATCLVTILVGVPLGLVAGYFGRWVDDVLMRITDALLSFPAMLLALGIMAILGRSLTNLVVALSVVYTPRMMRLVRASVLGLRNREFVEACRALGMSNTRILLRHVLPNALSPVFVQATITFSYAIRYEASLSFLGLGVPPPMATWGSMLADGNQFLILAPWMSIFPGLMLAITILGLNLLGDGLRDVLDPRLGMEKGR